MPQKDITEPKLINIPLWGKTKNELLELIVKTKSLMPIHSANSEILVQATQNEKLGDILSNNAFNIVDGFWVKKLGELNNSVALEKISGSDFIHDLCTIANHYNWRVFLLGASESVSQKSAQLLSVQYPQLKLDRYSPPFETGSSFSKESNKKILDKISIFKPEIIIVCFGAPKQELWVHANREFLDSIGVKATLSAGGSLDFVSGKVNRAPLWVQNIGMEWFYRLAKEPKQRFIRQFSRCPLLVWYSIVKRSDN